MKMNKILQDIRKIDPSHPWMWQVSLTDEEYRQLGDYVQKDPLATPMVTICWLAHWYRREYAAGNTACPLAVDAQDLWEKSGLDTGRFVYTTHTGRRTWLQSIYVLGGMAYGLANDERLLRRLCRIYHGEDENLEDLVDEERSAAFIGSIVHHHALYHYLYRILNEKATAADEWEQYFIDRVQDANNQELRQKFTLEWLIQRDETTNSIHCRLRVRYRPELTGEGMHQYLRHDRLALWGFAPHDTMRFALRFLYQGKVIQEAMPDDAFATFSNAGTEVGYLAWGKALWGDVRTSPKNPFDGIEIWGFADDDTQGRMVQEFRDFNDLSLCRDTSALGRWTSRNIPGRDKARVWLADGRWHWEYIGQEEYHLHRYSHLFRYENEDFIFYRHDIEGEVRNIEYKYGTNYSPWEDDIPPVYGFCRLRLTLVSGKQEIIEATLLPSVDAENPVVRNLADHTIIYRSIDGDLVTVYDNIGQQKLPAQNPWREIVLEDDDEVEFCLFVWHPSILRYAVSGQNLLCIIDKEHLTLPKIIAPRVCIHEYNYNGYAAYNHPEWPDWVNLADYNETDIPLCDNDRLLFWNYDTEEPPTTNRSRANRETLVAFQSLKEVPRDLVVSKGVDYGIDPWDTPLHEATAFDCFCMAREHKVYFLCFRPLSVTEWTAKTFDHEILTPLRAIRPQGFTVEDIIELNRLKDDLGLNFNIPRR